MTTVLCCCVKAFFYLCRRQIRPITTIGRMPERSIGAVSKTVVPSGTQGSNPCPSAKNPMNQTLARQGAAKRIYGLHCFFTYEQFFVLINPRNKQFLWFASKPSVQIEKTLCAKLNLHRGFSQKAPVQKKEQFYSSLHTVPSYSSLPPIRTNKRRCSDYKYHICLLGRHLVQQQQSIANINSEEQSSFPT